MKTILKPAMVFLFVGSVLCVSSLGSISGCGGASTSATGTSNGSGSAAATITIKDLAFSPLTLDAHAGDTIHVVNQDPESHTVTSESAENAFDDTGSSTNGFDTGTLSSGASADFTIPSGAMVGDKLFFYCKIHKSGMATPNGTITITQ